MIKKRLTEVLRRHYTGSEEDYEALADALIADGTVTDTKKHTRSSTGVSAYAQQVLDLYSAEFHEKLEKKVKEVRDKKDKK